MSTLESFKSQSGFSMVEMIVAITVMAIVGGAVFALMRDSMKVASTTYEMTDAQQNLRTAQEYINRDLMNAGDALTSISNIRLPRDFVTSYLTTSPVDDPGPSGIANLSILTSDNDVAAGTLVLGTSPAVTVQSNPLTDRLTILQIDPSFTPIALAAGAINATGNQIAIADASKLKKNEVYFLTSSVGGTFGTITNINAVPKLIFNNGDALGLNITGVGGQIYTISAGGTLPTSLMRVKIIHYYVTSTGLLMRRVFGVKGATYTDSLIAEHVIGLQFRYFLSIREAGGNVAQPVEQLTSSEQQLSLSQVEVTVAVETPHQINSGSRQPLANTTSTSVRNMQFQRALQPQAGN
jgi:prepilin-type N-terminal cleavage/methylation domain-containing protein